MTQGTQWSMRGDYFENCNCDVICPCAPTRGQARPDNGNCDAVLIFEVAEGNHGDVSLDGLVFVVAFTTPGLMSEGNGTAAVYVDERASPQQRDALSAVASGKVGGPPALIFERLIAENNFLGVKFVPISFRKEGHKRGVSIPEILESNVEGLTGANGDDVEWLDNIGHPANTRLALARGTGNTYRDYDFNWDNTGKNGHFAEFRWSGP